MTVSSEAVAPSPAGAPWPGAAVNLTRHQFSAPNEYTQPNHIVEGSDGNRWFTLEAGRTIGRTTRASSVDVPFGDATNLGHAAPTAAVKGVSG